MATPDSQNIDFSMLLASAAHDMKNSLGMLLSTLDQMDAVAVDQAQELKGYFSLLRGEASRINNDLIYLLSLYRLQNKQLQANVDEVYLPEFFEDQQLRHAVLLEAFNVSLLIDVADDVLAYFDAELIAGVLNNAIVNAAKYTQSVIRLSATPHEGGVLIEVLDDGPGFPPSMIDENTDYQRGVSFKSGSTNLGLFFSNHIAALHTNEGQQGRIELANNPSGGGIFRLILP
ncbi:MAG TPA: HAMP domain-containing sensor histidine kinase [Pseudomonadales bacterium]|nr:HAMP domain-containing sensor histidine kinase [Pseudomonadales bacterium]